MVELGAQERQGLEELVRAHRTPQQVAVGVGIVPGAAEGQNSTQSARQVSAPPG